MLFWNDCRSQTCRALVEVRPPVSRLLRSSTTHLSAKLVA